MMWLHFLDNHHSGCFFFQGHCVVHVSSLESNTNHKAVQDRCRVVLPPCRLASLCLQNLVSFGWDRKHTRRWNVSGVVSMGLPTSKAHHVTKQQTKKVKRIRVCLQNLEIFLSPTKKNRHFFNVEILLDFEVLGSPFGFGWRYEES